MKLYTTPPSRFTYTSPMTLYNKSPECTTRMTNIPPASILIHNPHIQTHPLTHLAPNNNPRNNPTYLLILSFLFLFDWSIGDFLVSLS